MTKAIRSQDLVWAILFLEPLEAFETTREERKGAAITHQIPSKQPNTNRLEENAKASVTFE